MPGARPSFPPSGIHSREAVLDKMAERGQEMKMPGARPSFPPSGIHSREAVLDKMAERGQEMQN